MKRFADGLLRAFPWSHAPYWLPLVPFFVRLNDFFYLAGSEYSDLAVSHLPNLLYLRQALVEYRTIPLWSPAILSGFPFFANPLSGLWYPPGWPAVVWPRPWAFNLLAGLHLVFGAYGMGKFLAAQGLRKEAQLLGGLAFGMMPKLLSHYAAGHITLVYAVAWTPWLLLAEVRPLRGWIRPGVLMGIIFLADPRWAAYAGATWLAWAFFRKTDSGSWFRTSALETGTALLLAAPLLVPLIEYSRLSTRADLGPAETLAFSVPPANLVGLLFSTPHAEWQMYPGILILVMAVSATVLPAVRFQARFWLAAAAASLVFALGESVPGIRLWANLPFLDMLRVPARALFVFDLAAIVIAGYALQAMLSDRPGRQELRRWNLVAAGFAGIYLPVIALLGLSDPLAHAALLVLVILLIAWMAVNRRLPGWAIAPVLVAYLWIDLFAASGAVTTIRKSADVLSENAEAVRWLSGHPEPFRVYSPSYSAPQQTAALYGLELASGVDPLQLQAYAAFMEAASGVSVPGYSIPLPPLEGNPRTANSEAVPDAALLSLLNVHFVAAEFDFPAAGLALARRFGETRVYANQLPAGYTWELDPEGQPVPAGADLLLRTPNRVELHIDHPGAYFISELDYPGWQVEGAVKLPPYLGIFRTFEMEGAGRAAWVFRPVSLYTGLVLGLAGILLVAARRKWHEGR